MLRFPSFHCWIEEVNGDTWALTNLDEKWLGPTARRSFDLIPMSFMSLHPQHDKTQLVPRISRIFFCFFVFFFFFFFGEIVASYLSSAMYLCRVLTSHGIHWKLTQILYQNCTHFVMRIKMGSIIRILITYLKALYG